MGIILDSRGNRKYFGLRMSVDLNVIVVGGGDAILPRQNYCQLLASWSILSTLVFFLIRGALLLVRPHTAVSCSVTSTHLFREQF